MIITLDYGAHLKIKWKFERTKKKKRDINYNNHGLPFDFKKNTYKLNYAPGKNNNKFPRPCRNKVTY